MEEHGEAALRQEGEQDVDEDLREACYLMAQVREELGRGLDQQVRRSGEEVHGEESCRRDRGPRSSEAEGEAEVEGSGEGLSVQHLARREDPEEGQGRRREGRKVAGGPAELHQLDLHQVPDADGTRGRKMEQAEVS